jgi:hypothetical protein
MGSPERVCVVVLIERTDRTVTGAVSVEGAPTSGFYGWLQLIDKLDRAAGRGRGPGDPAPIDSEELLC